MQVSETKKTKNAKKVLKNKLMGMFTGASFARMYGERAGSDTTLSNGFAKLYYVKSAVYGRIIDGWLDKAMKLGYDDVDYNRTLQFISENFDSDGMFYRVKRPQLPVYEVGKGDSVELRWPTEGSYFVKQDTAYPNELAIARPDVSGRHDPVGGGIA